ncbi:hypothetical protein [Agrobacterium rosae]|uniref:Uncharacterized protein n=1 Tax=Agrobacterium rosae TaxID=1972867 RepID=A0AAE5VMI8_9HYPH|nr:hypothetical protein [Agrobacterium rosae]KAA3511606.1 hypothetical protein DXM21_14265 [Agrobacterium rosae]KAA3518970.1 hypothetical protein DXM25_13750 [Agrobacterium rosae]MQB49302.1 hypothetical protein [Agrobacterium rosae]POO49144.1 hypothetical protein CPJ18_22090 [Agrobacterium rosae]
MNNIEKANAAIRLKENEDFRDLMRCIETEIFEAFMNTKLGQVEELDSVHQLSHGFRLINQRLDKYIEIAKFENSSQKNEEY